MKDRDPAWGRQQIVTDPRIDHEDAVVRRVAEMLHSNESMHLHIDISDAVCVYCALRASRVLRWAAQIDAGGEPLGDTPNGLIPRPDERCATVGENAYGCQSRCILHTGHTEPCRSRNQGPIKATTHA